jgi:hypothetical protein
VHSSATQFQPNKGDKVNTIIIYQDPDDKIIEVEAAYPGGIKMVICQRRRIDEDTPGLRPEDGYINLPHFNLSDEEKSQVFYKTPATLDHKDYAQVLKVMKLSKIGKGPWMDPDPDLVAEEDEDE